jgi:hypothetical protein
MSWPKTPVAGSGDRLTSKSELVAQKSPGNHLSTGLTSTKMLKGSWTHCPDEKSLASAIKRLQLSQAICDEVNFPPFPSRNLFLNKWKTTSSDVEAPYGSI